MSLTFIEQIKHDFNESHLKYYSILLNFDGVWDFAAAKAPKVGTKITQKGGRVITCDPAKTYPCGAICRSHSKDCSNPIEGQARTYAGWLEKQAMTKYDQTVISLKKEIAFNTLSETGKLPKKGDSVYLIADVNRATGEPLLRDYIFVGLSKDKKTATLRPKSLTDDQKEIAKKNPSNFDRKVGADEVVVTDLTLDEAQKYFKEQNIASTTREREVREARSLKTENTKEINTVVRPRKPTKKETPEPTIANRRKLTELPVEWKNLDSRVKEDIERNNRTNWGDVKVGDRVFDTNTQKYVTVNRKFSRHANATTEDGQKVKLQDYSAKKKSFDDLVLDTVDDLQTKREGQVKVDEKDKRPDSKVVEPTKKPQEQTDTKNKIISTDETLKDYATRLHGVDAALKKPEEIDAITKNYENAVISRIEKGDSIAPNLLRYGNLREYADKNGITDRLIDSVRKDVLGTYKPSARDLKDAAIGANKENPKSVDSQIKSLEESLAFQTYKNWQGSDPAKTKKQWEADLRYLTNVKNLQTAKSEPTKKPQEQTDTKKPDLKVVESVKNRSVKQRVTGTNIKGFIVTKQDLTMIQEEVGTITFFDNKGEEVTPDRASTYSILYSKDGEYLGYKGKLSSTNKNLTLDMIRQENSADTLAAKKKIKQETKERNKQAFTSLQSALGDGTVTTYGLSFFAPSKQGQEKINKTLEKLKEAGISHSGNWTDSNSGWTYQLKVGTTTKNLDNITKLVNKKAEPTSKNTVKTDKPTASSDGQIDIKKPDLKVVDDGKGVEPTKVVNGQTDPKKSALGRFVRDTLIRDSDVEKLPSEKQSRVKKLLKEYESLPYVDARTALGPNQSARMTDNQRAKLGKAARRVFEIENELKDLMADDDTDKVRVQKQKTIEGRLNQINRHISDYESLYSDKLKSKRDNVIRRDHAKLLQERQALTSELENLKTSTTTDDKTTTTQTPDIRDIQIKIDRLERNGVSPDSKTYQRLQKQLVDLQKQERTDTKKPNFSEFTWSRENIEYFKNFKTPCRTILSY